MDIFIQMKRLCDVAGAAVIVRLVLTLPVPQEHAHSSTEKSRGNSASW